MWRLRRQQDVIALGPEDLLDRLLIECLCGADQRCRRLLGGGKGFYVCSWGWVLFPPAEARRIWRPPERARLVARRPGANYFFGASTVTIRASVNVTVEPRLARLSRDAYRSAALIAMAIRIADSIVTRPGRMKLWSSTQLPIRVVPVWSKDTAASSVPYVGRKKLPLAAG